MNDLYLQIMEKYREIGVQKGGAILFKPQEVLRIAEELAQANLIIWGLEYWYYTEHNGKQYIAEEVNAPDFSDIAKQKSAQATLDAVQQVISQGLPQHIDLISFIVEH